MIPTIQNALKMATSELNIVTNNIANAGSTGFKRSDGNFLHSYAEDIPHSRQEYWFWRCP